MAQHHEAADPIAIDGLILALWKMRMDTKDIAARLRMRESAVANRLAQLRDRGLQ